MCLVASVQPVSLQTRGGPVGPPPVALEPSDMPWLKGLMVINQMSKDFLFNFFLPILSWCNVYLTLPDEVCTHSWRERLVSNYWLLVLFVGWLLDSTLMQNCKLLKFIFLYMLQQSLNY